MSLPLINWGRDHTSLKPISCLLYADDIILLSESAKGLQKSLDILKTYCDKWNLKINIGKTKVIVFNKSGRILKGFSNYYHLHLIYVANILHWIWVHSEKVDIIPAHPK
jgi:hypothetical protein